jgi:hypothetical protein
VAAVHLRDCARRGNFILSHIIAFLYHDVRLFYISLLLLQIQHDSTNVRRESNIRTACDDCTEISGPASASCLRGLRVSVSLSCCWYKIPLEILNYFVFLSHSLSCSFCSHQIIRMRFGAGRLCSNVRSISLFGHSIGPRDFNWSRLYSCGER